MPRIRWKAALGSQAIAPLETAASDSIRSIQSAVGHFSPYQTEDAQLAKTTVYWPPAGPVTSATKEQEHSEMVALGKTLAPQAIWQVDAAGQVVAVNGNAISHVNYFTDLPHCGYCTIMLYVLGLPLGVATKGRYNLAVNLDYTVPGPVFENFSLLARLVDSNIAGPTGWVAIKHMINAFIQNNSAEWVLAVGGFYVTDNNVVDNPGAALVLDWVTEAKDHNVNVNVNHYGQNSLLKTLWKFVYQGIFDNVG
ncbi:MAG: hypothetical protein V7641_2109 [Blastocatellia bacterium]